jgi:CelD/BcsL family acetyltransferase involved in cellulose biosynthesis
MKASVVRPDELGQADVMSWRAMQNATPSLANPFMSPEFSIAVGAFKSNARVAVLIDGPDVVGFFPFERDRFGAGSPIGSGLSNCQGLIHAPGLEWDAQDLLRSCGLAVWQFDHLESSQRAFQSYRTATRPSPIIDLTTGYVSYYDKLNARSPKFCRNVERRTRNLEREIAELSFVADSDDLSVLESLLAWKSLQYQRTGQVDVFAREWMVGLIKRLLVTREPEFGGVLSVLYAGGVPIAAHFGLRGGATLAHWIPSYDVDFHKYSPGHILNLRMCEFMPDAGIRVIDMGTGDQQYKEDLKNDDLFVGVGTVTAGSLRSATLASVLRARRSGGRRVVDAVKKNPITFATAGWLRTKYRLARSSRRQSG